MSVMLHSMADAVPRFSMPHASPFAMLDAFTKFDSIFMKLNSIFMKLGIIVMKLDPVVRWVKLDVVSSIS